MELLGFFTLVSSVVLISSSLVSGVFFILLHSFRVCFFSYVSARFYKMFGHSDYWKSTTLITAFFYPSIIYSIFFTLNLFIWAKGSTGAVPLFALFVLLVLWFGISVPLVFVGAAIGYKQETIKLPCRS